jgi:glutamate synthase (NADPH/NADH) small chain
VLNQDTKEYSALCSQLDDNQALVESSRCYFCYDAPCIKACPTGINIPSFIARINQDNAIGAGEKILSDNIMGGTCARVCPVEVLCEGSCVRGANDEPVKIGLLQRYATDRLFDNKHKVKKSSLVSFNKDMHVAVVGSGPAGLSCAYSLSQLGYMVTVYEQKTKGGGLNEYGLAPYKMSNNFAQKELDFILSNSNIKLLKDYRLGDDISLDSLRSDYDAVFLGLGLDGVNNLAVEDENVEGIQNAVDFIEKNRQGVLPLVVGKEVAVIGGGSTAIDVSIQAKLLGARNVTIFYRSPKTRMSATLHEQELAKRYDVNIRYNLTLNKIISVDKRLEALEFTYGNQNTTKDVADKLVFNCTTLFKAIGQKLVSDPMKQKCQELLLINNGKIKVNSKQKTSLSDVFAGGDCASGGKDLTVQAVQDGKIAALAIHEKLSKKL